jgi:uncharacterized protein YxjI
VDDSDAGAVHDEGMTTVPLLDGSAIGVRQRRKFFEMRNQYDLLDESGATVGVIEQVGQSPFTFLARLFSDLDVMLPVTLAVKDASGANVLRLHKGWFRLQVDATDPTTGARVGSVRKRLRLGKASFDVHAADDRLVGALQAQNWRARDFALVDGGGRELGRVTKQWRGLLTEFATDADSYAITFPPETDATTRRLMLAAALSVDLTMKQKDYNLDF